MRLYFCLQLRTTNIYNCAIKIRAINARRNILSGVLYYTEDIADSVFCSTVFVQSLNIIQFNDNTMWKSKIDSVRNYNEGRRLSK